MSSYLGFTYPQHVTGIHLNYIMDQAGGYRELVRSANLLPVRREPVSALPADEQAEEAAYRAELDHWLREEIGYSTMQGTKPQTLAYALTDSPVGLAAWIVEKFRSWSDCDGQVERCFSKDDLLTNIMLYWSTGAIGSSFWPYYAQQHEGWHLPDDQRVEVPTAYQSFPFDILHPPRARADRAFNIQRWTVSPTGGHFAALEKPQALAEDIRAFFRPLR